MGRRRIQSTEARPETWHSTVCFHFPAICHIICSLQSVCPKLWQLAVNVVLVVYIHTCISWLTWTFQFEKITEIVAIRHVCSVADPIGGPLGSYEPPPPRDRGALNNYAKTFFDTLQSIYSSNCYCRQWEICLLDELGPSLLNQAHQTPRRSSRNPAYYLSDLDFADDIALLSRNMSTAQKILIVAPEPSAKTLAAGLSS